MKTKKCRNPACRKLFTPVRPMQTVCGFECSHALIVANHEKAKRRAERDQRRETREKLEKLKTRSDYLKDAQKAFNAFIRARDKDLPCISCGTTEGAGQLKGGYWDCGHYRSTGSAPHMRFAENNAHKQCKRCNRQLGGNMVNYRKGLVAKIGLEAVEAIEADQTIRKWSKDDLKAICATYRAKLREVK